MALKGTLVIYFIVIVINAFQINVSQAANEDPKEALLIRVDPSGKGDYKKIQEAIDAVPSNNKEVVFISIKPGIYKEKIIVPADKPFITISGFNPKETVITWDDSGHIFESPTFSVLANDFVARFLTIKNTYGPGEKAVALRVSGDRAAFYGCRILSYQDTLLDDTGRHYYKNCYIEGATDFICGNAASFFEKCHVRSISISGGAITAQRRMSPSEETGFTFFNCKISGVKTAVLGRPWGPYSRVIFAFSYMSGAILPQGWDDWGDSSKQMTVYYGQYKCDGAGANISRRVEWALNNLKENEVQPFLTKDSIAANSWIRALPTNFRRPTKH